MNTASGILPIAKDTGKICLAWRSSRVNKGNCWCVIGGMCKAGSSPEDSAVIEVIEETGYIGAIKLYKAFVCRLHGFEYHNFIGVVPEMFYFNPDEMFKWETSFIEWFTFHQIQMMIAEKPSNFHKGLIQLWKESNSLINQIAEVQ
jgi:8-oxo-dGTP pyrophosphatase MutT (NUDIX family)